jgi:hypothetical protein
MSIKLSQQNYQDILSGKGVNLTASEILTISLVISKISSGDDFIVSGSYRIIVTQEQNLSLEPLPTYKEDKSRLSSPDEFRDKTGYS